MATVRQTVLLQDKMSNTLSKIQKNALQNITTFNKMSKEIDAVRKSLEEAEKLNPEIVKTEVYANAVEGLTQLEDKLYDVASGQLNVEDSTDDLKMSVVDLNQQLEILGKSWRIVEGAMQAANQWMQLSNNSFNAEYTAAVKMHNVLGASEEEITSMYQYASALQEVGVVEDDAIKSGMSTLSMFADSIDQINQLTPAILDLAVAQEGLNVTQATVESYAQRVGYALNGNATMLKRLIGASDEEIKRLNGMNDKAEKSAYLFDLIERSANGANKTLAKTAQGGIMQANNALGDLQERLGTQVIPYLEAFKQFMVTILEPIVAFVEANSSWLIPTLIAVGAGIAALIAILTIYNVITWLASAATWALASPLLIVVALIAGFVLAINLAAQALSEWAGTSVSAMGLVFGAINVLITGLQNVFIDLFNIVQGVIDGIALLFIGLAEVVIGVLNKIAQGIDAVFGSNLSAATQNLLSNLDSAGQAILQDPGFVERKSYSEAFDKGYDAGANLFEGIDIQGASTGNISDWIGNIDNISNNLDGLVGSDGAGGKALKTTSNDNLLSDEDVQLLLDVATRDYQLNYQQMTPNISVSMGDIRETADVNAVMDVLGDRIEELLNGDAEVVDG